ncbi:MAG TPA: hypothetical protein VEI81_00670 [Methanoregula sp.]|nr:hypothetical protein [Methanoregula sp.]
MDDLVLAGGFGLLALFIAGLLVLYGGFVLLKTAAESLMAGDFAFVALAAGVILAAVSLYAATGIWLQRTNRI